MKTKNILIYGAIAAGAYLAYKYFMKPKAEANFANANGGFNIAAPSKYYFFQKYSNYPKVALENCFKNLNDRVINWRLYYTQPMDLQQMESFFEDCLKAKPIRTATPKANISSVIGR